ncbi:alpha/beta fold hydrolase [Marivivens donghaensis]|jgi:proline iminopeptidase|uniref:alpha/beta fold hydrolase n=1 Tax=Marivivens donghaensis TaxID=1699413 RepID=UPI003F6A04CB
MQVFMTVLLAILGIGALGFTILLWTTRVPPTVRATVTDDAALPKLEGHGVMLHGRILGNDSAPLAIVLHGGPGGDHCSLLALEGLTASHRVLFYDQRGAGLSERVTDGRLGIEDHIADLDTLIATHGGGAVVLIGHSWGAMLATAYLGHRPEAVARAVLIEPGFLDADGLAAFERRRAALSRTPRVIWAGLLAGFRARAIVGDVEAGRDSIVGTVVHAFANHPVNPYHCAGQPYDAPSWRFGSRVSDTFWRHPFAALGPISRGLTYTGPVLILAGGCNDWTGPSLQTAHAEMFPDAQLVTIPEAGHDTVWDQPKHTLRAIRTFLAASRFSDE